MRVEYIYYFNYNFFFHQNHSVKEKNGREQFCFFFKYSDLLNHPTIRKCLVFCWVTSRIADLHREWRRREAVRDHKHTRSNLFSILFLTAGSLPAHLSSIFMLFSFFFCFCVCVCWFYDSVIHPRDPLTHFLDFYILNMKLAHFRSWWWGYILPTCINNKRKSDPAVRPTNREREFAQEFSSAQPSVRGKTPSGWLARRMVSKRWKEGGSSGS